MDNAGKYVTSKSNANSIFLPVADDHFFMGSYWTSSLNTDDPHNARHLNFSQMWIIIDSIGRDAGCLIRPVIE